VHDYWIDAKSFLELRHDRPNRNAAGIAGVASQYYRDYHTINGLTLPFMIETGVGMTQYTDKMIIEKIALNPEVAPRQFEKPLIPRPRNGVTVNAQSQDAPR
jgi:hypothetical protein